MKSHEIVICVSIFVLCWLILGLRGVDAGIIGPGCFIAGLAVHKREQAVASYIDRLKASVTGWFKSST